MCQKIEIAGSFHLQQLHFFIFFISAAILLILCFSVVLRLFSVSSLVMLFLLPIVQQTICSIPPKVLTGLSEVMSIPQHATWFGFKWQRQPLLLM